MGYVTRDLQAAVDYWIDVVGAGPFFFAEYAPIEQVYRGRPTDTRFRLAYGYAGDLNIEVVEQVNDAPSAYTEVLRSGRSMPRGGMFHHVMMRHDDYDAAYAGYLASGAEQCFDAVVPGVGRYCYLDTRAQMDCYVELLELCPAFDSACARMRDLHLAWDGSDPKRSFDDLIARL